MKTHKTTRFPTQSQLLTQKVHRSWLKLGLCLRAAESGQASSLIGFMTCTMGLHNMFLILPDHELAYIPILLWFIMVYSCLPILHRVHKHLPDSRSQICLGLIGFAHVRPNLQNSSNWWSFCKVRF